ncbi:MAG TPA: TRAP transporter substrate-binding protein DctP [Mycobacteriales bacterium]|nr:TRAP transporter substrate-binding protein DctP [Mycobacteriales bacterium]
MTARRPSSARLALPAVAGLVLLAACGGGQGGDGGTQAAAECGEVSLRLTHQWPDTGGEEGDFRAVLAQRFADQASEATDGQVTVEIFPNSSLVKATEQYDSMMQGGTDMSVFPLDYAAGRVPDFSVTLMPALVRNHEEAQAWHDSEIGERLVEVMDENGVRPLTHVWNAGAIGAKGDPIVRPGDVRPGSTTRAAGSYVERMLESAGAGITSLPSSEIYTAMQTGVLDSAVTSTGSFASFNLQEQVRSFTSPAQNTFWFMYEPLIISNRSFERLCQEQQDALIAVGEDLQEYAFSASEEDDARVEQIFSEAGVEVVQMDDAAFEEWRELARPQWEAYATSAPNGRELLDLAKQVSAGAAE